MTYAPPADRAFPPVTNFPLAALAGAIMVAAILAFAAINPFGLGAPSIDAPRVNSLLLASEGRWELQHRLVSGDIDPLTRAEREWERQHVQLSAAFE
jgi:hypothetical protein